MGNCVRRETGIDFDEENEKIKNLDEINKRIVNKIINKFTVVTY
jgi:hypothetical protein